MRRQGLQWNDAATVAGVVTLLAIRRPELDEKMLQQHQSNDVVLTLYRMDIAKRQRIDRGLHEWLNDCRGVVIELIE